MKIFHLLFLFSFVFKTAAQNLPPITIVSENFRPYNYIHNGEFTGPATEIIREILKELEIEEYEIQVYPWARAYQLALEKENVLIFSIARIPQRENLFKWIGQIETIELGIVKLKSDTSVVIDSIQDIDKYRSALFLESPLEHYLDSKEIPITYRVGNYHSTVQMLVHGRVDLIPTSTSGFLEVAAKLGYDKDMFEVAYRFTDLEKGLWAAFSKSTADSVVEIFINAYNNVMKNRSEE